MRGEGTLRFRNLAQKVLWDQELAGQISDGRWENSRPFEHWIPWCDATTVVDPDNVGRDFHVVREGYCFTEKDLLEVIGERMEEYVRVATGNAAYSRKDLLKDLRDIRAIIKTRVPRGLPVPPQPEPRKAQLVVEGYAQNFTVYVDTPNDPAAVAKLAERDRQGTEYRVGVLEKKHAEAQAAADKLAAELEATRAKLRTLQEVS